MKIKRIEGVLPRRRERKRSQEKRKKKSGRK